MSMPKRAQGCRPVDPIVVSAMLAAVERQTDRSLQAQFGLGYNSWVKLKAGLPIRASLASRIEQRVRQLATSAVEPSSD